MDNPPTRRQRRKESRPGEIIAAALTIFQSKGFAASKIEDVAQAAGVTKGTVYLYFPSKAELFKAVIRETVLPNLDLIEAAAAVSRFSTNRACVRPCSIWAGSMTNCRGSFSKLIIAEAGNFPELGKFYREEVIGRVRRVLTGIIGDGIAQGEFRSCNPSTVVRALCAPVLLSNIMSHTFTDQQDVQPDLAALTDSLLDIISCGINPRT